MKRLDAIKDILIKKRERIALAKQSLSQDDLKLKIQELPPTRAFIEAINKPKIISLIAEIKKASPSKGIIRENFDLKRIASIYKDKGVQAISVLTEEDYFQGSASFINEVKAIAEVPILRKDFILEPYQVYESRYFGADAILLIADLLSKDELSEFMGIAAHLGMDCLVEVHNEKQLKKILNMKMPLIGINNRDLHTMDVDFKTTERLFPLIPKDNIVVIESGIKSYQDVLFLKILGANAVLIGQAFMEAADIGRKVEEIMGW